ncbi:MAG TPA: glycosyl hydrolase, partial [Verrucomicrobia bacterium]|nr:glycosyl hydrolase [Verrucomicrobiota bacterium]
MIPSLECNESEQRFSTRSSDNLERLFSLRMPLMQSLGLGLLLFNLCFSKPLQAASEGRPVRLLFLGHEGTHHPSDEYYPILARELGPDAIYFDYTTDVSKALDPKYLFQFDGLVLYANHGQMTEGQLRTLLKYVEEGGGFIPLHCASACFTNQPDFIRLVGGQFQSHGGEVFRAAILDSDHPAMNEVESFSSWDETYVHSNHNEEGRTVLMERVDARTGHQEPWTWIREQGKGRVFYTASGHDRRTWDQPGFHQLVKSGILWAVGERVSALHARFLATRHPLEYERRDNIANYERRPQPLAYQLPLSPEDSMDYLQAPIDFRMELFAAEPQIINPICMAWDERGRLWVAEAVDYPNELKEGPGRDSIKILEDTNGDGRCDRVTVFAEGFNMPTSLTFADGGVIVAHAPDFLFLKDTDGDDRADVRKVLFTGWSQSDTHAGPSNLRYGIDNWIYGTVGYAGFQGDVGGESHNFRMGVFRFRSDGSSIEFLHQFNNNTWGVGFNDAGDVFGSTANNNPSFFGGIPVSAYGDGDVGRSAKMIAQSRTFHPITPQIRQVDAFGNYTAGCGHSFASSNGFPVDYRDQVAFINGPTGNLVGRYRIQREGAGFTAKNGFAFFAGVDEWFSPVAAEVGPDGALWVADWYNFIIQHNPTPNVQRGGYDAVRGAGNAHINPNRDRQHGRIYRVIWNEADDPSIRSLAKADSGELLRTLNHANRFWRITAQRLLMEKPIADIQSDLEDLVFEESVAAIHAFWILKTQDVLDSENHLGAMLSRSASLRRNAVKALGTDDESVRLFFDSSVIGDEDLLTRLAAFNKLAEFPGGDAVRLAVSGLLRDSVNRSDEWLSEALKNAARRHHIQASFKLGPNLFSNPSFELADNGKPENWNTRHYSGQARHVWDSNVSRSGKHSLRISSDGGADTSWYTDIEVKPHTEYRLSTWIKTDSLSGAMGAMMNLHVWPDGKAVTG